MKHWLCTVMLLGLIAPVSGAGEDANGAGEGWPGILKGIPDGSGALDFGGSLRLRWEYAQNFDVRRYNTRSEDDVLLQRARLWGRYRFGKSAFARIMLQDSRFCFSDQGTTLPYYNPLDVREAYVDWQHIGDSPFGFKVGRQSISYGDNRIFGPREWGNVGRYAWDAAVLTCDADYAKVDLLFGQRVLFDPDACDYHHHDYDMFAVYAQLKKRPPTLKTLDFFWALHYDDHDSTAGESGTDDRKTHTIGTHFAGALGEHWDYGGTVAVQRGEWGRDDIDAYGLNARAGYTFDGPWSPRVGVEYSYASGDSSPNDGDHETFDNVFGAIDCYYGRMNLVSWMNLEDYQATFSVKPVKNLKITLDYHFFRLASDNDAWYYGNGRPQRRDTSGTSGSSLGQETDLTAKWKLRKNLEFFVGFGHFSPGAFINHTGRHGDANWGFGQLTYSF